MTIKVINEPTHFAIATNPERTVSDGITGSRSRSPRSRIVFDETWTTQENWSTNNAKQMKFDSRDDAEYYLSVNRAEMERRLAGASDIGKIYSFDELDEMSRE